MEQQMRLLHEILTNRKSRSLFSGAKRWFGQNKPGAATTGTSVVYGKDAMELQTRKLGDLYFACRMYKLAYNCYHLCKKDFQADEAWNYYAGAAEMCALTLFMQADPSKKYPNHYMEDAVNKYLQVCQMPEYAVRATVLDAMCLKSLGMYQDAAARFSRMTSESKDLRSSLLFEQAAYCHLLATPVQLRKYAFHIILAGYRYSKAGQKGHAVRAYRQGAEVFKGRGWRLAEDHILYSLGHQALLMKDYSLASGLLNELLAETEPGINNALQEMCHLREFFIVNHMREKEENQKAKTAGAATPPPADLSLPTFHAQHIVTDLGQSLQQLSRQAGPAFLDLERAICERVRGQEILVMSRTCQQVFRSDTSNGLAPQVGIGEQVRFMLPAENKFHTPMALKKVQLMWEFKSSKDSAAGVNADSAKEAGNVVQTGVLPSITLEPHSTTTLDLSLTPLQAGEVSVVGVEYAVRAQFPTSEATDYWVRGRQKLSVRGPRLQATKEQRTGIVYGPDLRLCFNTGGHLPKLRVDVDFPPAMAQGEVRELQLQLENVGSVPIDSVHLATFLPGMLSMGDSSTRNSSVYDFPVVWESALRDTLSDGSTAPLPLDIAAVADQPLAANGKRAMKMWLRAPEQVGQTELRLHWFYQWAAKPGHLAHRIQTSQHSLRVYPSVAVSAGRGTVKAACGQGSKEVVAVHVSSVCGGTSEAAKRAQEDLGRIVVEQVTLLSHRRRLSNLTNNTKLGKGAASVGPSETLAINLATDNSQLPSKSKDADVADEVLFSTVKVGMADSLAQADHPPWRDFFKGGFQTPSQRGQSLTLTSDLVAVFWRSSSGDVRGQHVVPLRRMTDFSANAVGGEDSADGPKIEVAAADGLDEDALLCDVSVEVKNRIQHDFQNAPVLTVPLTVLAKNVSCGRIRISLTVAASASPAVVGSLPKEVSLDPKETLQIPLNSAVLAPGLYHCQGIQVVASSEDSKTRAGQPQPLTASFFVRQE